MRIFDSGLLSGAGQFAVKLWAGNVSTNVVIIMNEGGNPSQTEWRYSVTPISQTISYAVFTEDTNLTTAPIKFATPPFRAANLGPAAACSAILKGSCRPIYPAITNVDGWAIAATTR